MYRDTVDQRTLNGERSREFHIKPLGDFDD
jgi:hypothetical protein